LLLAGRDQGIIMSRRILILIAALAVPLSLVAGPAVQAAVAQGASSAVITPSSGPPGSTVKASGANWTAGDDIQAEWGDDYSDLGSPVVVASDGTFTDSFAIPSDATVGSHQVLFWDQQAQYFVVADFDVTSGSSTPPPSSSSLAVTGVPTVGYYLPNGAAGPTTNVPGWHDTSAFVPGEPIEFTVAVKNSGTTTVPATLTFAITGPASRSWTGTAQIPPGTSGWYLPKTVVPNEAPQGTYTITVTVSQNGVSSSGHTTFTVTGQGRTLGTGLQTTNPYPFGHTDTTGQCTYGADELFDAFTKVLHKPNGEYLVNMGDAYNWGRLSTKPDPPEPVPALGYGWTVSSTPQYASIAVFPQNYIPGEPNGHVAWVTNIYTENGSTWVTVDEMNGTAGPGYFDYYSYKVGAGDEFILITDTANNTWAQVNLCASHSTPAGEAHPTSPGSGQQGSLVTEPGSGQQGSLVTDQTGRLLARPARRRWR
jgi:surface antigen